MILFYLLKVSACTAMFFAVYQLFLVKLTFFNLNRIYLLLMLLLSFTIPALTVERLHDVEKTDNEVKSKVLYSNEPGFEKDVIEVSGLVNPGLNWMEIFNYLYVIVFTIFIMRWLFVFFHIKNQLLKHTIAQEGDALFVHPQSTLKNCSFFNTIVIDSALPPGEKALVIKHETVHVQQFHALDKVLVNLATAVLWFNPVIYFWRNAIDHNHEFLADREISKIADKNTYASLLLNLAMPANHFSTNNFSKLPLKNRIMMMYKESNSKLQKLAYLLIVPVILVCSVAFVNRKDVEISKPAFAKNQDEVTGVNVSPMDYSEHAINLNPSAASAFKEVDMILVVDAGHGGKDDAVTALDGQKEKDLNLRAVKILKEEAAKRGIKVILTRSDDQFLSLRDRLPKQKATAFISIHHNATLDDQTTSKGIEVYVSKLNSNIKVAENLGAGILNKLNELKGIEVKPALKDANLLLLRESKVPAVLIEMGNISDERNLKFINDKQNVRKMSNLILDGFVSFVKTGC
ncbi:N-acetylmuramoyl-L-alanine amidase [Pedobacter sp. CFBP9032]|uniref:N-acetylmuramoyl-L-alanine amidase n=1 Tax=Pedobacter sp. CFBP9032 TaxID=3096539 RepID=UPI002A6B7824|nr:N-acetylmuramoyl-L-alanine amidase [Pedobacter sp. CFBP9032]MDY0903648.1 N-acetylmuramoyl-L-alanine amidase [Pedobacter sp. CFBP9032]